MQQRAVVVAIRVGGLIEIRERCVVIPVIDGVVRMCMTLHTLHRCAHPGKPRGDTAIHHCCYTKLLIICATLIIGECEPMKGGGNSVILCGAGQQITSEHSLRELVIGHVAVPCINEPIPESPHFTARVFFISLGVCIASKVKPDARPSFPECW